MKIPEYPYIIVYLNGEADNNIHGPANEETILSIIDELQQNAPKPTETEATETQPEQFTGEVPAPTSEAPVQQESFGPIRDVNREIQEDNDWQTYGDTLHMYDYVDPINQFVDQGRKETAHPAAPVQIIQESPVRVTAPHLIEEFPVRIPTPHIIEEFPVRVAQPHIIEEIKAPTKPSHSIKIENSNEKKPEIHARPTGPIRPSFPTHHAPIGVPSFHHGAPIHSERINSRPTGVRPASARPTGHVQSRIGSPTVGHGRPSLH